MIKTHTKDLFDLISEKIDELSWQEFMGELKKKSNRVTLEELSRLVSRFAKGHNLTLRDKQFIYQTFKVEDTAKD